MLKILLDARKLGDGGIGTYLNNLIKGLTRDPRICLEIIVASGKREAFYTAEQVPQYEEKSSPYSIDELCFLGARLSDPKKYGTYDIFHEPHYTLPGSLNIPAVVTIHDLIHISNPEHWYYPTVARFLIKRAINKAKKIIAVSEATKKVLIETFPSIESLPGKLHVISNAMAENLLLDPPEWNRQLENKFGLKPGYLFALFSMLKPHKGFSDLVEAYSRARANNILPQLVVAGRGLVGLESENIDLFKRLESSGIKVLGEVSEAELAGLYKGAVTTIIPSLAEGFGLSALEAKVLGSPLLVRPLPSLNLIIDSDDIVCADMSLNSLSQAIVQVVKKNPNWQERPRNSQLAERFSVQSVAAKTVDVYVEAIQSR